MFPITSTDGENWAPAGSNNITYHGGLTEIGFYFDLEVGDGNYFTSSFRYNSTLTNDAH